MPRALLSISFSRGFGLTASQLGALLAPDDHPLVRRFEAQWNWFTYLYNAIAARAFLALDLTELAAVGCAASRRRARANRRGRNDPRRPAGVDAGGQDAVTARLASSVVYAAPA